MTSSPTIKLNSGHEMPLVGFGLWKVDRATCADTVYNAIKEGYRLFDGACDYGNEVEAGKGVARALHERLVKRSELFLVSKLWNSFHSHSSVASVARKQLSDWGIEYFDLYLIHFPIALAPVSPDTRYPPGWYHDADGKEIREEKVSLQDTWKAMEELVKGGVVKSIGISNYAAPLIQDLLRYATIRPSALQIEHHPYLSQPQLIKYVQGEGIAVTAYSSFGPQSFLELGWKKAHDTPLLFENPTIKGIAEKKGKTPAQVLLRWATQRGIAVIPKSNNASRLKQNLDVTGFELGEEDLAAINGLDQGLRFNNPPDYLDGKFPIFA